MGGIIFGEKGPAIPFLLQNKKAGKAKINTGLIKIIASLNKIKEKVKTLREAVSFLARSF